MEAQRQPERKIEQQCRAGRHPSPVSWASAGPRPPARRRHRHPAGRQGRLPVTRLDRKKGDLRPQSQSPGAPDEPLLVREMHRPGAQHVQRPGQRRVSREEERLRGPD